ncbi:MAG: circadian clock KaiB family protein [Xenococcaceae cyanobacterium]
MSQNKPSFPQLFKGIALFTPGGDLIYCIDPSKQGRWHLHLCVGLQEILGLPEPPHFLVPGYTATVDRWLDPHTQQLKTLAEVYPAVQRYQPLLNAVFGTGELVWQTAPWQEESCNPIVLETYRDQFPQLWEDHDLIVRFQRREQLSGSEVGRSPSEEFGILPSPELQTTRTYVLRLFVSGSSTATEQALESIHRLLEQGLPHPYTLKVIDISKHPEQAETNQVSATPTLVRVLPQPVRRIVGELEDIQRVLQILTTC